MVSDSLHPYEVKKEGEWNYFFTTKHGVTYHAYFIDFSDYHPSFTNVYTFNIEPETTRPHPIDKRIALTVIHILKEFFRLKRNAMLMVCDNLDGKETKRELLFTRWFNQYNDGCILKYDASSTTDDYILYVSFYIHKDNAERARLVSAFYDLVKNNFYPET